VQAHSLHCFIELMLYVAQAQNRSFRRCSSYPISWGSTEKTSTKKQTTQEQNGVS